MQLIDTNPEDSEASEGPMPAQASAFAAGRVEDIPPGTCRTIELPSKRELAVFNVSGEFYATENFCPHKGAPLAHGNLCEHVIECDWHGWQFDVRTGDCLTVPEKLQTYEVVIEDGVVKVLV